MAYRRRRRTRRRYVKRRTYKPRRRSYRPRYRRSRYRKSYRKPSYLKAPPPLPVLAHGIASSLAKGTITGKEPTLPAAEIKLNKKFSK